MLDDENALRALLNASMEAYRSRTHGSVQESLERRVRALKLPGEDAQSFYASIAWPLLAPSAAGDDEADASVDRCRFLAWFAALLFSTQADGGARVLHEAGMAFLVQEQPRLARVLFWREWQVRKKRAAPPSAFIDVWVQLAVASDECGRRATAKRLLRRACAVHEQRGSPATAADMAYRLSAACFAVDGDIASARQCLAKAEALRGTVYSATPTQVHLAWVRAICLSAFQPLTLYQIAGLALSRIAEDRAPDGTFIEMDGLQHALARTSSAHLAVLSIGATLRLIDEGHATDVTTEDVVITRNNFGNALLHAGLPDDARQAFTMAVEALTRDPDTRTSPALLHQLAHASAGVGYSYYNEANLEEERRPRATAPPQEHGGLRRLLHALTPRQRTPDDALHDADRWLTKALEALNDSKEDSWIDARIWASSARVCSRLGDIDGMHRRFARALLAGRDRWHGSSEQLSDFFNPDFDTRLKYMEALFESGCADAAVVLAKAAVHAVHLFALPDVSDQQAQDYVRSRGHVHRRLVEHLGAAGRHNEAEQAYDLLKLHTHSLFDRRSVDMLDVAALVGLTRVERDALDRSGVRSILDSLDEDAGSDDPVRAANELANAFQKLDASINELRSAHDPADAAAEERRLKTLTDQLGPRAALIRYLAMPEALQIVAVCDGQRVVERVPIARADLSHWVFELRQQCRHPRMEDYGDVIRVSRLLHDALIAPVRQLFTDRADTLYLEVDQPLAGMPFAAIHDGQRFLAERYAVVFLNRAAHARATPPAAAAAAAVPQVSIFVCSDAPGAPLPGAAREGDAVAAGLSGAGGRVTLQLFAHADCTSDAFLAAIREPGRQHSAIHLASHASFNATSDQLSFLLFHDDALSVHRLREALDASGCDTGLFVLSACGTARQDVDVEGFSTTLLRAGVSSVVATLWESIDFSAPEFFRNFYSRCGELHSPRAIAGAVQRAQAAFLTSGDAVAGVPLSHPAHWAPYVVSAGRI